MAQRRPPGFTVALRFYDSEEVLSIPRKIRAEAVGAWTLCGSYSANQLSDGYVSNAKLKQLGVRPAIRAALMVTTPEPLWVPAANGDGIQFTRWEKWQRTADEIRTWRRADADRKKRARSAESETKVRQNSAKSAHFWTENGEKSEQKLLQNSEAEQDSTCGDTEMSGRTSAGRSQHVRSDHREPKPEPEPEKYYSPTEEHSLNVGVERGLTDTISPTASRLVATVIPDRFPAAVRTALRLQASQLMNGDGLDADTVADALRRWLEKPNAGPGLLPSLAADVMRARAAPSNGKPASKLRSIASLAAAERAREQAALETNQLREIE